MFGDRGLTRERTIALAGTAVLLVVLLAITIMVLSTGGGGAGRRLAAAPPDPTRTPRPTATARPRPTPVPLTAAQRRERDQAVQQLQARGYAPVGLRAYRATHTLRVLLGRPIGATSGARKAFFFVKGAFVGNDSAQASGSLITLGGSDTQVTLRYRLFAPGDAICCPSAGVAKVRFGWDGARLRTLDALPDARMRLPPRG